MKKVLIFILCAVFLLSFNVFADEKSDLITVNNSDNALLVYNVDELTESDNLVFGITEAEFKQYMKANNMVLYGAYADNSFVFNLSCSSTDFSNEVSDFYDLSDSDVLSVADNFMANNSGVVTVGGVKYVVADSVKNSNETIFSVRQYITVRNNYLYVFTFNVPKDSIDNELQVKIGDTLERISIIREQNYSSKNNYFTIVMLVALILVVAAISVVVIISLIKDIKLKK